MPQGIPKPLTTLQMARYGHVAAALRVAMDAKGWDVAQLNEALKKPRAYSGTYHWTSGRGAPDPTNRAKLVKLLGIPEADLRMRDVEAGTAVTVMEPRAVTVTATRMPDVLAFSVAQDGNARIRLDLTLPIAQATPLLRMLLDAGVVFSE